MTESLYCVRWKYHQSNLISEFSSLLSNKTLVDVTLTAEGKNLKAHKVILSACSLYFKELFEENLAPHPILIFNNVSYRDLQSVVEFIYSGKIELGLENFQSVINVAETLRVKGLIDLPVEAIRAEFQARKRASSDSPSNHRAKRKKHSTGSPISFSNSMEPVEELRSTDNSEIEKSSDVKPNLTNMPKAITQTQTTLEISSSAPTNSRFLIPEDKCSNAVTIEDAESSDIELTLSPEQPSSTLGLLENNGSDHHVIQRQDSLEPAIKKKGCELSNKIMSEKEANTFSKLTNTQMPIRNFSKTIPMPPNKTKVSIRPYQFSIDYSIDWNCILMKHLPVPVTKLDIVNFFRPVKPRQIHIVFDSNFIQTGQCYCEFPNKTDIIKVISKKNYAQMKQKSVTLTMVSETEMLQAISCETAEKTYPYIYPNKPILSRLASRLKSLETPHSYSSTRSRLLPYAKQLVQTTESVIAVQNFGNPNCTVSLKNVPFRCRVDEILKFFYEFGVQKKDVIRKFSGDGLPTGNFRVRLSSPFMAQQAVQRLNGKFIEERKISVRLLADILG